MKIIMVNSFRSGHLHVVSGVGLVVILVATLILVPVLTQKPTLAVDSGFEGDSRDKWEISSPERCRVVSDECHSGKKSLLMTCNGELKFVSAKQTRIVDRQGILHFSAWVKLKELQGTGAYATISWFDSTDKLIDIYYFSTIVGTLDWTRLNLDSKVPDGAKKYMVGLHVYPAERGMVWFDDVSAEIKDEVTLRVLLKNPAYRKTIYSGKSKEIEVGTEVKGTIKHPIDTLAVSVEVLAANGQVIGNEEKTSLTERKWEDIRVGITTDEPGECRAIVKLKEKDTGEELKREELAFNIPGSGKPRPKVYIDEHNRCVINGELFFPVGYYTWGTDRTHIAALGKVVETKFNCVINYSLISGRTVNQAKRYMDEADKRGLKVLISTKHCYDNLDTRPIEFDSWEGAVPVLQGAVASFRTHPAVLGWYINDERSDFFLPQISRAYEYISANDPDHIVYQVLRRAQYPALHIDTTDVIGNDCYPVHAYYNGKSTKISMDEVRRATDMVSDATMGSRAMWEVVECSQIASNGRPPTLSEMMCESYIALARGSRGLFFFALPYALRDGESQMQALKALGDEMEKVRPVALGIDVFPEDAVASSDNRVISLTRITSTGISAIAVNPSSEKISVTFRLGEKTQYKVVKRHVFNLPDEQIQVKNGEFKDEIEPLGTRLYNLVGSE